MNADAQAWMDRAEYDLDTAEDMLKAERGPYVLFMCQQAIEKALKALLTERTGQLPRRTHDLLDLAREAGIEVGPELGELLGELTLHYTHVRYPDAGVELPEAEDMEKAHRFFEQTKEFVAWVKTRLE